MYLLFYGPMYYPLGGWGDFAGSFDSIDEALKRVIWEVATVDWCQIVDTTTLCIVYDARLSWDTNEVEVDVDGRDLSKGETP